MKRCPNGATINLPNGTKVSLSKITVKDRAKIVRFSLLIHYTECAYHENFNFHFNSFPYFNEFFLFIG